MIALLGRGSIAGGVQQIDNQGSRVMVRIVLAYVAKGDPIAEMPLDWPQLTCEAIQEAIRLAAAALLEKYPIPAEAAHEPNRPGRSA